MSLPRIDLSRDDNPGFTMATIEFDPNRFGAIRTSLGQTLRVPAQVTQDSRIKKLLVSGIVSWSGEQDGIPIPAQPIVFNENFFSVPISDEQIARFEGKRAGQVAVIELRIRAFAIVDNVAVILTASFPATVVVQRDEWIKVLEMLGWGTRRLIELPTFPKERGAAWNEIAQRLDAATRRLAAGDSGAAMTEARVALERMIEAIGKALGLEREKTPLKNFAEKLAAALQGQHVERSGDHFAVLADSIRLSISMFGFSSEGAHSGFDAVERANAELAIGLVAALYTHAAKTLTASGLNPTP